VWIARSARILVLEGAHLEIGGETTVDFHVAITCAEHIHIGPNCAISWNSNTFSAAILHELVVAGVPRPRTAPVYLGDHAGPPLRSVWEALLGDARHDLRRELPFGRSCPG
jgi:acetyltransferase-like isoleucine patch superfamily enzyme